MADLLQNLPPETLSKESKIWTIDASKEMLEGAMSGMQNKKLARNVEFALADTSHLGFESEFSDLIVFIMVLHRIPGLDSSLSEMTKVLKKWGGCL